MENSGLRSKIRRVLNRTWKAFKSDAHFSLYYASLRLLDDICGRIRCTSLSNMFFKKRSTWLYDKLKRMLSKELSVSYIHTEDRAFDTENAPIWICWWTGLETAPALVKKCIESTMLNSGSHPVHFIDSTTISKYLDIPTYILNRHQNGQMLTAHFADYIRVCLLEKYGGIWIDATIYTSRLIDENVFKYPFYTIKGEMKPSRYVSDYMWSTFIFAGHPHNSLYVYLKNAFETYWKNESRAIDYLFFDYIIRIAYDNIPAVKGLIDSVPYNNPHIDDLAAAMNASLPADQFSNVIEKNTLWYKISWRETYSLKTEVGTPSVYSYFLNET